MKTLVLVLGLCISTHAFAIVKECSEYPLITYPERTVIKRAMKGSEPKSAQWGKLTTTQRISICRALANILRKQ